MIPPEKATSNSYVVCPDWSIQNMPSCCAARVLSRLEADYCTKSQRQKEEEEYCAKEGRLEALPPNFTLRGAVRHTYSIAQAIPREQAFAAVLEECSVISYGPHLFICTDNVQSPSDKEPRDQHPGPFAPRYFVEWLLRVGAARVVESYTLNKKVRGWMFVLNEGTTKKIIKSAKAAYRKRYNYLRKKCKKLNPNSTSTCSTDWLIAP